MSEKQGVMENILNGQTWLRALFMFLFVLIYGATEAVVLVVVFLQFFFVLFTGTRNPRLQEFGQGLSVFVYQIMAYWTYNSEDRPFPFGPWPGPSDEA